MKSNAKTTAKPLKTCPLYIFRHAKRWNMSLYGAGRCFAYPLYLWNGSLESDKLTLKMRRAATVMPWPRSPNHHPAHSWRCMALLWKFRDNSAPHFSLCLVFFWFGFGGPRRSAVWQCSQREIDIDGDCIKLGDLTLKSCCFALKCILVSHIHYVGWVVRRTRRRLAKTTTVPQPNHHVWWWQTVAAEATSSIITTNAAAAL